MTREVSPALFLEPTGLRRALRDERQSEIFRRMEEGSRPLGEVAKVGVGIQESTNREEGSVSRYVSDSADLPNAEPVLRGREVMLFGINWEGKYLSYGPHLTYAGDPGIFRGEKILYQNLRHETLDRRIVATLDRNGYFPKNSLSYICRPQKPFSLAYILGIINSSLVNAWFRDHYFSFHVTVTHVRRIPIPEADEARRKKVEEIVERLLSLSRKDASRKDAAWKDANRKDVAREGVTGAGGISPLMLELDRAVEACFFSVTLE